MNAAIRSILAFLDQNKAELAVNKFSGVYKVNGVYRIHETSVIPKIMDVKLGAASKVIKEECEQFTNMTFDANSLWLTITE